MCVGLFAAPLPALLSPAAAEVVIITTEEASLPAPTTLASARAITRGPRIEFAELADKELRSPFRFKLQFRSFGGSAIDPNSLVVTYIRSGNVDLTRRLKPFVQAAGIDIPDAVVPPGHHLIRVDIRDSDGRAATANVTLNVAP